MTIADETPQEGVSPGVTSQVFSGNEWSTRVTPVPSEMPFTIYINGQEVVTMLCTPAKLNCLVLGFMYSEGIIKGLNEVVSARVCEDDSLADVKLTVEYKPPEKRMITSGCGGGTSFAVAQEPVKSDLRVTAPQVLALMKQMQEKQEIFQQSGGIHCSALCTNDSLLVISEDIGRHNTLDKIAGECLLRKLDTRNKILITTGRISSEMVYKAARMQVPVVASRSGATDRAINLGQSMGISVVGYVRVGRLSVFTYPERLQNQGG